MNVALNGRHDDFPLRNRSRAVPREVCFNNLECFLRRPCRVNELWQEQFTPFKAAADRIERRNEQRVDNLQLSHALREQRAASLSRLLAKAALDRTRKRS